MRHFICICLIIGSLFSNYSFAVLYGDLVTEPDILNSTVKITGTHGTCTGIILGKRTVLSAAHCIDANLTSGKPIFVQKFLSATIPGDVIGIIFYHSTGSDRAGEDVGFIYLDRDLEQPIKPIKIASSLKYEDILCMAGQGMDETGFSGNLKMICGMKPQLETHFGLWFIDNPKDHLSGFAPGDSGGPVYKKSDNGYELVGVMSRGNFGEPVLGLSSDRRTVNLMTDITRGFANSWINTNSCIKYNFQILDPELCH